jgi:hypothetical protein
MADTNFLENEMDRAGSRWRRCGVVLVEMASVTR